MAPSPNAAILVMLCLASPAAAQEQPWSSPRHVVVRSLVSPGDQEDQVSLLRPVSLRPGSPNLFWIVERRVQTRHFGRASLSHQWIDGRACPALDDVLSQMTTLRDVKTAPIAPPPLHAPFTRLRSLAPPDSPARSQGDADGVVSRWWLGSERILKACWRDRPPALNGQPLPTLLSSYADATAWKR